MECMVVTTATPVRAASCAAFASGPRISPTTMMSGLKRSAMSRRAIWSTLWRSFSESRVRVWMTELTTLPSILRTRASSLEPFSML